jgi:outer membrane protein OmpA-like peptidoglycan-associated protein
VTRVALPIQFRFDSTDFTEAGAAAAADLADYLRLEMPDTITLVGHADPTGNPAHNRRLSLRRAEAVRDFLRARGFAGDIRVEGRGQDEPFDPATPAALTVEQLHQLHRRVELRRQ